MPNSQAAALGRAKIAALIIRAASPICDAAIDIISEYLCRPALDFEILSIDEIFRRYSTIQDWTRIACDICCSEAEHEELYDTITAFARRSSNSAATIAALICYFAKESGERKRQGAYAMIGRLALDNKICADDFHFIMPYMFHESDDIDYWCGPPDDDEVKRTFAGVMTFGRFAPPEKKYLTELAEELRLATHPGGTLEYTFWYDTCKCPGRRTPAEMFMTTTD